MRPSEIVALGFAFLGLFASDAFAIADKDGPKIGSIPPPLTLSKTIQGPPATEISWDRLKGKVVVLEFWATWCGPCVANIPHLNDLAEQFQDRPVVFISVTSQNEDLIRFYLKNHPFKTWVGLDDYETLNREFHVKGIPHTVIVDASGRVAAIAHPSKIKPENLEEVLAGKKCSLPEPTVYTVENSSDVVSNQEPALFEISICEHKMPQRIRGPICMWSSDTNRCDFNGKIATVESALNCVFDKTSSRTIINCKLPDGYYDFVLRVPLGRSNELRNQFIAALHSTFGLKVRQVTETMDAYVLTQSNTNAPGLHSVEMSGIGGSGLDSFHSDGCDIPSIGRQLEEALGKPVFDETSLNGWFAVNMKWTMSNAERLQMLDPRILRAADANPRGDWISTLPKELREGKPLEDANRLKLELAKPAAKQFRPGVDEIIVAARQQLGLQLTRVQRPVEILEVSQASQ